ncbi:DUF4435 domain-containing protein [Sulfitobacter sp. LCG007]
MDDFANYLTLEAESSNAIFHEFMTSYNDDSEVHVFLEGGEDFVFYLPEIRRVFSGRKIIPYNCAGKWNVVEAKEVLEENYSVNAFFFVDRDLDDFLERQPDKDETLYITDAYSIESTVSSQYAIEIVCSDYLALSPKETDAFSNSVRSIQSNLSPRIVALMAWIIASKHQGRSPNLNNTNGLKGILSVSAEGRLEVSALGFSMFKKRVDSGKGAPNLAEVVRWYRIVHSSPVEVIVRGKYLSTIFCKSICLAVEHWNASPCARKIVAPELLKSGKNMELLAGRVPYPASLTDFLQGASSTLRS